MEKRKLAEELRERAANADVPSVALDRVSDDQIIRVVVDGMAGRKVSEEELASWIEVAHSAAEFLAMVDPHTDEEAGELYRQMQMQTMFDEFEEAHGRPPQTTEELAEWLASRKRTD